MGAELEIDEETRYNVGHDVKKRIERVEDTKGRSVMSLLHRIRWEAERD